METEENTQKLRTNGKDPGYLADPGVRAVVLVKGPKYIPYNSNRIRLSAYNHDGDFMIQHTSDNLLIKEGDVLVLEALERTCPCSCPAAFWKVLKEEEI